jgi:hypothetical protein
MRSNPRIPRRESCESYIIKCDALASVNRISCIAFAVALSSCGGGGGTSSPAPGAGALPDNTASVTWNMQWAANTTAAPSKSKPLYLAPTARSASIATITTDGVGSSELQFMNAPSTTLRFSAPTGLDTFRIETYDEDNGQGNVLSIADVTRTIKAGTANVISATLNGVIASLSVALSYPGGTAAFQSGTPSSATVDVTAYDSDGNAILESVGTTSDYNTPIHLSVSKTIPGDVGLLTLGTSLLQTTSSAGSTTTLAYDGGRLTPSADAATITASALAVPSASANVAVTDAEAAEGNIYVANAGDNTVTTYTPVGLSFSPTISTGLILPTGLAVDAAAKYMLRTITAPIWRPTPRTGRRPSRRSRA